MLRFNIRTLNNQFLELTENELGISYTISRVEIFEISDGISPDNALLSNKLPHQKRKRVEDPSNIRKGLFSVTIIICLDCKRGILLTDGLDVVAFPAQEESIHSMSYCSYGCSMNTSPYSHYMQVPKLD